MNLSSRLQSLGLVTLALATGLTTAGCAKDPGDGSVTITYDWLLGSACDDPFSSGPQTATQVRVTLTNGDDTETETAQCDDDDVRLDGVKAGSYTVLVEALDADGDAIADNLANPTTDESLTVSEGNTTTLEAELGPAPAIIEVALVVNNASGFQTMCDDAAVKFFNVRAIGQSIGELHSEELDYCTHGTGFVAVPDEMRRINGLLLNRIDVAYSDPDGSEIDELEFPLGEPIGAGKTVQIRIDCDETDCLGVLTLPDGSGGGGDDDPTGGGDDGMGTTGGGTDSGGADSTGADGTGSSTGG